MKAMKTVVMLLIWMAVVLAVMFSLAASLPRPAAKYRLGDVLDSADGRGSAVVARVDGDSLTLRTDDGRLIMEDARTAADRWVPRAQEGGKDGR